MKCFFDVQAEFVGGAVIGSAIFAQCTVECPITLQWAAMYIPPKIAPSPWGVGSSSNTWYLGPTT